MAHCCRQSLSCWPACCRRWRAWGRQTAPPQYAELALAHLRLLGSLCATAVEHGAGKQLDCAFEQLDGTSGTGASILASMHELLGWVAAAAPGVPAPVAAPPALGALFWQADPAVALHHVLGLWASLLEKLINLGLVLGPWSGAAACAAGAATAQATLRLAPLLLRLSVAASNGDAVVVVPASGMRAGQHLQRLKLTCPPCALCVIACLAPLSLCASLASSPHSGDEQAALALFHTAQTAVKYEWAVADSAASGNGDGPGGSCAERVWEPVV